MGFFVFRQKTAYEMRISDWSSDVCSSDLPPHIADDDRRKLPPARLADRPRKAEGQPAPARARRDAVARPRTLARRRAGSRHLDGDPRSGRAGHRHRRRWRDAPRKLFEPACDGAVGDRSEEHTSELQSLMRISYAVFCLKKTKYKNATKKNKKSKLK